MWLVERVGQERGRTLRVRGDRWLVGRSEECDLTIRDSNVSRWHAYLAESPDGAVELHDLGSQNGTWVDGRRVERATLRGGEQLQFGDTVLLTSLSEPRDDGGTAAGAGAVASPGAGAGSPRSSAIRRALRADSVFQRAVRDQSTVQRAVRSSGRRAIATAGALAGAIVLATLLLTGAFSSRGGAADTAVARMGPATVLIEALDEIGMRAATGSGWALDADEGLVVTNAHVVNDGVGFRIVAGGRRRAAQVVSAAPCEDLALLRLRDTRGLRQARLGSQDSLRPGETVVALGFPGNASLADELTATEGIVSVVRTSYRETSADVPAYPNVVQTDAAINPGNSGGPLVDGEGRLIGVNSAVRTRSSEGRLIQGQSYAIGVDRVKQTLRTLRTGRSIGWIGAGFDYPKDAQLRSSGLPEGLFLARAVRGTPAQRAGLGEEPLLLVGVGQRRVRTTLSSYCEAVRGIPSGARATLSVVRTGSDRRIRRIQVPFA